MKRKILGAFIIIFSFLAVISYAITQYSYSHGVRSGKLVKLSKRGVLIKTYEGTLDLGSGSQLTWDFSVHNKAIGEQLVAQIGKEVRLEYRELLFKIFFATKYDIEAWSLDGESVDTDYLCRLTNFLRRNSSIVGYLKPLIQKEDYQLLKAMKDCQR